MNPVNLLSNQQGCLTALLLVIILVVTGCSGSNRAQTSDSPSSSDATENEMLTDAVNDGNTTGQSTESVDDNPAVTDPLVQNSTLINFDITVPAYQSNELSVQLEWGDMSLSASWVGDEFWSASAELPTEKEHLLSVTFYDRDGDIALAQVSQLLRTGSNASQAVQITADQFDAAFFDNDEDGVTNLDEMIAGTDPTVDEDTLLEIRDYYVLAGASTSRMSVSSSVESRVGDDRPFFDTYSTDDHSENFPGSVSGSVDIDVLGNGTVTYDYAVQGTSRTLNAIRTRSENSITWEGDQYAYDGDYGHRVNFNNTVTVVDDSTRTFVEDIVGSNGGTYFFSWEVSTNLTGELVDGSSYCTPAYGTILQTYRSSRVSEVTLVDTTVTKDVNDPYWRVITVVKKDDAEADNFEHFARDLIIYQPTGTNTIRPENANFKCDFVDFD